MAALRLGAILAIALAGIVVAAGCDAAPRPTGEGVGLQALFSGGYRALDHDVFDGHPVYAFELATRDDRSGWGYELGGSFATEDAGGAREHSADFDEVSLGLRRSWRPGSMAQPYLGFGGAMTVVRNVLHSPRSDFDDHGGGAYARGGVLWDLGSFDVDRGTEVLLGFDVRGFVGDDYNSGELALVLGFGQ